MRLSTRIGFGLLACAVGLGCDSEFTTSGPVRICSEAAVQCIAPEAARLIGQRNDWTDERIDSEIRDYTRRIDWLRAEI